LINAKNSSRPVFGLDCATTVSGKLIDQVVYNQLVGSLSVRRVAGSSPT
jgi:hypothetical protein